MNLRTMDNFPYLTQIEFTEASKHLCKLLSLCSTIDHRLCLLKDDTTYIVIKLEKLIGIPSAIEVDLLEIEYIADDQEQDSECIFRRASPIAVANVEYHIVLSPVYCIPVLYFNMTIGSTPASLEQIYEHLVRQSHSNVGLNWEKTLRTVGINGAISQGEHPILETPFWFIHPCETAALLENWGENLPGTQRELQLHTDGIHSSKGIISLQNYLQIWLGMIGGAVGLYLPAEAVTSQQVEK